MGDVVTVLFGGPSPEHDISILTGLQCERVLRGHQGMTVNGVYWDRTGNWQLVPPDTEARDYVTGPPQRSTDLEFHVGRPGGWIPRKGLRRRPIEAGVVLNCLHGGLGEGGGAQALLALAGLPSTGSSVGAASIGMDKYAFGAALASAGVPTLRRELLTETSEHSFDGPIIVKPRFGGSSIGIEIVDSVNTARALLRNSAHLRDGAIVEPFRDDLFDLNIAYRTYPDFELSQIERPLRPDQRSIYSFEDKYLNEAGLQGAPRELPAKLPEKVEAMVHNYARMVYDTVRATGIVRIDFLSNGVEVFVNEANTIPGAMALYLWPDHDVDRLLIDAVEEARQHFADPVSNLGTASPAALQVAGGISSKLAGMRTETQG